jgi:hypothetical protein
MKSLRCFPIQKYGKTWEVAEENLRVVMERGSSES